MRKWEEIVKNKLEGYESALPEGSWADLEVRRTAPKPRRIPWGWVAAAAVAASLAAVLFPWKPAVPEGDIRIAEQPSAPVLLVSDSTKVSDPELPIRAHITPPARVVPPSPVPGSEESRVPENPSEPEITPEPVVSSGPEEPLSSFIPQTVPAKPVRLKVGVAAGAVAGGGLLAAVVTPLVSSRPPVSTVPGSNGAGGTNAPNGSNGGLGLGGPDSSVGPGEPGTNIGVNPLTHYFPLRVGLSARIPLSERLQITTGLEYSLYRSQWASGQVQSAHYLGIPVRLDWSLAKGRWLDVYVGGGLEGDLCLGATLDGQKVRGDGPSLSLQGAGGLQFNVSRHIGLFVEPELSWRVPLGTPVLKTYRSEHPLMFSVATGIRINLNN